MKPIPSILLFSALTVLVIPSCVDPMYAGGGYNSGYNSGYNTYTTLPGNYSGSAYLYNGRYYSGGRYQTGTYRSQGRSYSDRYYYNGQYLYGGSYQNYPGHSQQSSHSQSPSNHRENHGSISPRYPQQPSSRMLHPSLFRRP